MQLLRHFQHLANTDPQATIALASARPQVFFHTTFANRKSLLHFAIEQQKLKLVDFLISHDRKLSTVASNSLSSNSAIINRQDERGLTPLMTVCLLQGTTATREDVKKMFFMILNEGQGASYQLHFPSNKKMEQMEQVEEVEGDKKVSGAGGEVQTFSQRRNRKSVKKGRRAPVERNTVSDENERSAERLTTSMRDVQHGRMNQQSSNLLGRSKKVGGTRAMFTMKPKWVSVKLNKKDQYGSSALVLSLMMKNLLFAYELLIRGASKKCNTTWDITLLHYLALIPSEVKDTELPWWAETVEEYKMYHTLVCNEVVSLKIDPKKENSFGETPLHLCIICYNLTLVKCLLRNTTKTQQRRQKRVQKLKELVNYAPEEVRYPMYDCIFSRYSVADELSRKPFLELLLENGADVNLVVKGELADFSVLMLCLVEMTDHRRSSLQEIVWLLLYAGADVNFTTPLPHAPHAGMITIFEMSLRCNSPKVVSYIMSMMNVKPDMNRMLSTGCKPVEDVTLSCVLSKIIHQPGETAEEQQQAIDRQAFIMSTQLKILELIVQKGAKLEWERTLTERTLLKQYSKHKVSLLHSFIAFHLNDSACDSYQVKRVIERLIKLGGDVNFHRAAGPSLLMIVVHKNDFDVARELVKHQSSLDFTVKLTACARTNLKCHRIKTYLRMIDLKTELNMKPHHGFICDICQQGIDNNDVIKMCNDNGCDFQVCQSCLFFDSNSTLINQNGSSVVEVAKRLGHPKMINLLTDASSLTGKALVKEEMFHVFEILSAAKMLDGEVLKKASPEQLARLGIHDTAEQERAVQCAM